MTVIDFCNDPWCARRSVSNGLQYLELWHSNNLSNAFLDSKWCSGVFCFSQWCNARNHGCFSDSDDPAGFHCPTGNFPEILMDSCGGTTHAWYTVLSWRLWKTFFPVWSDCFHQQLCQSNRVLGYNFRNQDDEVQLARTVLKLITVPDFVWSTTQISGSLTVRTRPERMN